MNIFNRKIGTQNRFFHHSLSLQDQNTFLKLLLAFHYFLKFLFPIGTGRLFVTNYMPFSPVRFCNFSVKSANTLITHDLAPPQTAALLIFYHPHTHSTMSCLQNQDIPPVVQLSVSKWNLKISLNVFTISYHCIICCICAYRNPPFQSGNPNPPDPKYLLETLPLPFHAELLFSKSTS